MASTGMANSVILSVQIEANQPSVNIVTCLGIDANGLAYHDPTGVVAGEQAVLNVTQAGQAVLSR